MKYKSLEMKNGVLCGAIEVTHDINIGDAILNSFKSRPDFIGQVDSEMEEQITFQQMRENSVKFALWLQKKGFGYNNTISICIRNQTVAYIPLLASIYIGAIVSPWDHKYLSSKERILLFLITHKSKVIFVDDIIIALRFQSAIEFLWQYRKEGSICPKVVVLNKTEGFDSLEVILKYNFDDAEIDKFSCVKVLNDLPKFAANATYPGLLNIPPLIYLLPSNQQIPFMITDDVGLWYGSLCWTHSILLTIRCIISYVTVIKSSTFSEVNLYETIEKYKVSWVFLDSDMCNQLLQTNVITKYNLSCLREFIFSNLEIAREVYEGLIKSLPNTFITRVYSFFKTHIICAYQQDSKNVESIGHVANNIQLKFIDLQTGKRATPYVTSEIWYRFTYNLCTKKCTFQDCKNYKTKGNFVTPKDVFSKWVCTEDLGYYDENGNIFIIDKKTRVIRYKNFLVSSTKIENLLQRHPAVSEVVVLPESDSADGHHPTAYVKKKRGAEVTEKKLIQFVANNLPDIYKLRGGLFFKDEMPYLSNGKIDRRLIRREITHKNINFNSFSLDFFS